MQKIKQKDEVIIIAGKDKGTIATVVKVMASKVLVEGVNIAQKHVKPNPKAGISGGVVPTEMPLNTSNVAIYNTTTKKADKVGIRTNENGNKERFFKSNGEVIA